MRKLSPSGSKQLVGSAFARACWRALLVIWLALLVNLSSAAAEVWISEILFNPPGSDSVNEYVELRGTPNLLLPDGTYLVAIEGNSGANPGVIQNAFDLSGRRIGGNGFLVLLQNGSAYLPDTNSTILQNTGGPGWGSGSSSSIAHRGRGGQTELSNASVTFFLLQSTNAVNPGDDLDLDNDGIPDSPQFSAWTVLDSVGVLDADGPGDAAYGAVNFRRNSPPGNGAIASGTIISVGFTPRYIARFGNSTGTNPGDWVASDALAGAAPSWSLGPVGSTYPVSLAGALLGDLGAPNFAAPAIPGIVVAPAAGLSSLLEGGAPAAYTLHLTTVPSGPVIVRLACSGGLLASVNNGTSYDSEALVVLTNCAPATVLVRVPADNVLDVSPPPAYITHSLVTTAAPFPASSIIPPITSAVREGGLLLFSELKVNPPGTNDTAGEFIELLGSPGIVLSNVLVLAIDGNSDGNPGKLTYVMRLDGVALGTNGLLLICPTNSAYSVGLGTTIVEDPQLNQPGGALGNGSLSFFLITTRAVLALGDDLDKGDNGVLEGLPPDATVHDSVGWSDGGSNDRVYALATLKLGSAAPDAAVRFPGNRAPNDSAAWFCGELLGPDRLALEFDPLTVSSNFPADTILTPGRLNNTAPRITALEPVSGVIGDPGNPSFFFQIEDSEMNPGSLTVFAESSNPQVVPSTNLFPAAVSPGLWQLSLNPVGVGYANITLGVSDGSVTGHVSVPYAASAPGWPDTVWHIGASDGSTAIPVGSDFLLLGDDENQTLRVYQRRSSGLPLAQFDMTAYLALPDIASGLPREVDIEASTRLGSRLYWMGSHGHGAEGEPRTNRTRIFATDLVAGTSPPSLTFVGRYDYLKLDLLAWDTKNIHGKGTNYYGLAASDADNVPPKAPDGSGLSIEGLSIVTGSSNAAYIAFRAPIVPAHDRNYALVVPVLNFTEVVDNSAPAGSCVFGPPIELDLYGRGIRSIEGSDTGFMIIGGPAAASTGPYPADFRLYTWTGLASDLPRQRSADLSGLNPEGLVGLPSGPWTADTQVELLSDCGATAFYGDGVPAKRLSIRNFKKSRSDLVRLGAVVKPAPIITSVTRTGPTLHVKWRSLGGELYLLESKAAGQPGSWKEVVSVIAPGPYAEAKVQIGTAWEFFRVRVAAQP